MGWSCRTSRGAPTRSLLTMPYHGCDGTAVARLERVRLIELSELVAEVERPAAALRKCRRGWSEAAGVRVGIALGS